jgi:peptidoglycan-associated lipoprotein
MRGGANNKNMVLGEKRAKAVYDFLLLSGVNKNQLSFIAYGEKAPLCQEDNEKCWDQNNRVHVVVTEKA